MVSRGRGALSGELLWGVSRTIGPAGRESRSLGGFGDGTILMESVRSKPDSSSARVHFVCACWAVRMQDASSVPLGDARPECAEA